MCHIRYILIEIVKYTAFIIGIHALMQGIDTLLGVLLLGIGILAIIRSSKIEPPPFILCLDSFNFIQKTLIQSAFVIGYGLILLALIYGKFKILILGGILMLGSIVWYKILCKKEQLQ